MRPTRVEKSHLKNSNHCTQIIHEKKGVYTSAPSEYRQSGTLAMASPHRTKTAYTQGPGAHYCARILSVGTWQKGVLISVSSEYRGRAPCVRTKF